MTAVRALRRGDIVVVLYDLPRQFGRTVAVDFFGRHAQVVRGPAEIAVLGRADVLPMFTHYEADGVAVTEAKPVIAARAGVASERAARTPTRATAVHAGATADSGASEPMVALDVRARVAGDRTGDWLNRVDIARLEQLRTVFRARAA